MEFRVVEISEDHESAVFGSTRRSLLETPYNSFATS